MKKFFAVVSFASLLTITRMCMGFVIAKFVAVYSGPSGMAMLGQLQSVITGFTGLAGSPMGACLVRYTSEYCNEGYEKCSPYWKACTLWSFLILFCIVPPAIFYSDNISLWILDDNSYGWLIVLAACFLPLSVINAQIISVLNGIENYRRYILLGIVSVVISAVFMILLIVYWGLKGALIAAALGASLPGLIMLISSLNSPWLKFRLWFGGTSRVARKAVAGYILMAVASVIFGPASLILVRNILVDSAGWEVAGHWQSVFRISEVYLSVLTVALGTYVLPKLSSLKDNQSIKHEVKSTLIVVAPLSILLAILIYLFRDLIITLLFTDEFRDARDLFSIQLAGDVLKICSWVIAFPLVSKGLAKIFIITEVLTNSMFVVLAYYFVDGFGVQGANIAYFLTYFIYFISMSFLMKKVLV